MNTPFFAPGTKAHDQARQRAANIRLDLARSIGLYAIGDRAPVVLRTLADAHVIYKSLSAKVPAPRGVDPSRWPATLDALVRRFHSTVASDKPCAA